MNQERFVITDKISEAHAYTLTFWSTLRIIYKNYEDLSSDHMIGFCVHIDAETIVSLFSDDQYVLSTWKDAFASKIIIQGFYDEFRALRKLGSGKTAEVYLA